MTNRLSSKDLFSTQSSLYAKFRPGYPKELFDYILQFTRQREKAWDVATGNGQAAGILSQYFAAVEATDISAAQLEKAVAKPNIRYSEQPAEQTDFPDHNFDLITIATAYHWLQQDPFREEAIRTAKNGAVIAAWAYQVLQADSEGLNEIICHFYHDITGPYWDPERSHVDDGYRHLPFDFDPLPGKDFVMEVSWTKEQLTGYLSTWSAVQHYITQHQESPLLLIEKALQQEWPDDRERIFRFPLFLKLGRISK